MFGGADWVNASIIDSALTSSLNTLLQQHHERPSRATAVVAIAQLLPPGTSAAAAAATAGRVGPHAAVDAVGQGLAGRWDVPAAADAAVLLDSAPGSRPGTPELGSSRPTSPFRFKDAHGNTDGSVTYSFEEDQPLLHGRDTAHTAAAGDAAAGSGINSSSRWDSVASSTSTTPSDVPRLTLGDLSSSASESSSLASNRSSSSSSSSSYSVDSELARQGQQQQAALEAYGTPGQPSQLALLCFEDVIQPGVPTAVEQLQSGSWSSSSSVWGRRAVDAPKDIVMLTGAGGL
jgi:hypothetical protein